jgi:hypothetical protein
LNRSCVHPVRHISSRFRRRRVLKWKNAAYWTRVAEDLRTSYRSICAYSAQWIPRREGVPSVDHYVPKSHAYRDVLDPFTIAVDSFVLSFPDLLLQPNATLSAESALAVDASIKRLRLNDENSIKSRLDWLLPYCQNVYPFDHVRQRAPFIAYELERQPSSK